MQDFYCHETDQFFLLRRKFFNHLYMFLKRKDAIIESQYSTKIKNILLIHSPAELIYGIQQSHVDQKTTTR